MENKVIDLSSEFLLSVDEINAVYSHFLTFLLRNENSTVKAIKVDSKEIIINNYDEATLLELEKSASQNIEFKVQSGHYEMFSFSSVSFIDVEALTGSGLSYSKRLEVIRGRESQSQIEIANEISELRKELYTIKNKPIKELLQNRF